MVAHVRRPASDENLPEDFRHALSLVAVNPALPLTMRGEIVTPGWLLANPVDGYGIITGEVTRHLERMDRERWLVRMQTRAEAVRDRAKMLEIELDEDRIRIALLASSRANLEAERDAIRRVLSRYRPCRPSFHRGAHAAYGRGSHHPGQCWDSPVHSNRKTCE